MIQTLALYYSVLVIIATLLIHEKKENTIETDDEFHRFRAESEDLSTASDIETQNSSNT